MIKINITSIANLQSAMTLQKYAFIFIPPNIKAQKMPPVVVWLVAFFVYLDFSVHLPYNPKRALASSLRYGRMSLYGMVKDGVPAA